ncbi:hypothetical protein ACLMAJ_35190 [Nocardia sp. KC 131]
MPLATGSGVEVARDRVAPLPEWPEQVGAESADGTRARNVGVTWLAGGVGLGIVR